MTTGGGGDGEDTNGGPDGEAESSVEGAGEEVIIH